MSTKWEMGLEGHGRGYKYNQNVIYEILEITSIQHFLALSEANQCAYDGECKRTASVVNADDTINVYQLQHL